MSMTKSAWIALACFVSLALAWGAMQFYFWAPSNIARDSFVYALKVPPAAKEFALFDPQAAPTYDLIRGDGPAPSYTLIRYRSKLSLLAIEQQLDGAGFECQKLGAQMLTCDRSRRGVLESQVTARGAGTGSPAEVTVYVPKQ